MKVWWLNLEGKNVESENVEKQNVESLNPIWSKISPSPLRCAVCVHVVLYSIVQNLEKVFHLGFIRVSNFRHFPTLPFFPVGKSLRHF